MAELIWRKLKDLKVPDPQDSAWTPALDHIIAKRLYRLRVKQVASSWKLDGMTTSCTVDGTDLSATRTSEPICAGSPFGALVGKVGVSTADHSGVIFAVGRYCIYQVTDESRAGPLYLGANDLKVLMSKVNGQVEVDIEIAL
jgi:hypothetical protein